MLKILIADDSEMLGDLFAEYLNAVGFNVTGTARTLNEALALADAAQPDVAVLDYCLGCDVGTEFVRRLAKHRRPAILYLSGKPLANVLTSADGEGFVQKPIGLSDLALCVSAVHDLRMKGFIETVSIPAALKQLTGSTREASLLDPMRGHLRA